jgi:hypothetical protein
MLSGLDYSYGLDRDAIPESIAFAIYDAGYKDVTSDAVRLGRLDDFVVC